MWVVKVLQIYLPKNVMHLPAIEAQNVQFHHLKISLVGRNVQKLFYVLNAVRRNKLQIINNKIHKKRNKTKK